MRNVTKKTVGIMLATLTTAALAASAFAAEYTRPESSVGGGASSAPAGAVTSPTTVASAGSSTSVSTFSAPVSVSSSTVKDLAASGGTLVIEAPEATVSIDSSTITKAKKIDLTMKVYGSASRSVIDMRSKKDFGCEVEITVKTCKMSEAKLAKAHVYCNGEDLGKVELNDAGQPVVTATKGGKYIIK